MHVFCDTVGCRLNQSESDSLAADFRAAGDEVVARLARAGLANRILPTRLAALENGVFLSLPATDSSEPTVCQDGS